MEVELKEGLVCQSSPNLNENLKLINAKKGKGGKPILNDEP